MALWQKYAFGVFMPKISVTTYLLWLAAALSVVIDALVIVGWGLSLVWIVLLIVWLFQGIYKKQEGIRQMIAAACVPLFVFISTQFIEQHIDKNLNSIVSNSAGGLPIDKNDLLTNTRLGLSLITSSRVLFYSNSEKGAIVVLRRFPFNMLVFNLKNGARKIRAYD
jgi:hypothetical protein